MSLLMQEFYPQNPRLLGLNVGGGGGSTSEICIRLRPASSKSAFLPYESILGTMLHEMAHNIHGNHAAPFYKLLDELTAECEDLMARGVQGTGAGFDAPSAGRIGGKNAGRVLSAHDRRLAAVKAAEERARRQAMMPSGPQKVGGDLTLRHTLPPALAAAAAAERRARDNMWCPTEALKEREEQGQAVDAAIAAVLAGAGVVPPTKGGSVDGGDRVSKAAESTHVDGGSGAEREAIVQEENGSGTGAVAQAVAVNLEELDAAKKRIRRDTEAVQSGEAGDTVADVIDLTADDAVAGVAPVVRLSAGDAVPTHGWACPACTFQNPALMLQCEMCYTLKPEAPD